MEETTNQTPELTGPTDDNATTEKQHTTETTVSPTNPAEEPITEQIENSTNHVKVITDDNVVTTNENVVTANKNVVTANENVITTNEIVATTNENVVLSAQSDDSMEISQTSQVTNQEITDESPGHESTNHEDPVTQQTFDHADNSSDYTSGEVRADPTEDESFLATIGDHLKERRLAAAVDDLANESNRHFLYEHGLDLVPMVGECLATTDHQYYDHYTPQSDVARRCQHAFQLLAERGNPKEVLLELLGQLQETGQPSPVQFHVLLPPIRTALLRTAPTRRDASLRWVLGALLDAFHSLPPPPPHAWVDESDDISPPPPPDGFLDPDVETVSGAADELLRFCQPLVEEVSLFATITEDDDIAQRRRLLAEFEVALLGEQFVFLDLSSDDNNHHVKSFQRLIAEHLIVDLCKLESDFYRLYSLAVDVQKPEVDDHNDRKSIDGDHVSMVSSLALANFAYLVHGEGICAEHLPAVYTHRHALRINVPLASLLLRHHHPGAVDKGLRLTGRLIELVAPLSLGVDLLDSSVHLDLGMALVEVAVYCRAQRLRISAVDTLGRYVERFDADGRFALIYRMLNACAHSGVQALLIQLFKNNLCVALESPFPSATYVGRSLSRMLHTVLRLEDGVRTDLTERCERTLAALNLLRYLLIRDPKNVSGVWKMVPALRESYLRPLQTALDLSRAHYQLEFERLSSASGATTITTETGCCGGVDAEASVTVDGRSLPFVAASLADELEAVRSSLTAFDLIQSVLCRVNQLLDLRSDGNQPLLQRSNSLG